MTVYVIGDFTLRYTPYNRKDPVRNGMQPDLAGLQQMMGFGFLFLVVPLCIIICMCSLASMMFSHAFPNHSR